MGGQVAAEIYTRDKISIANTTKYTTKTHKLDQTQSTVCGKLSYVKWGIYTHTWKFGLEQCAETNATQSKPINHRDKERKTSGAQIRNPKSPFIYQRKYANGARLLQHRGISRGKYTLPDRARPLIPGEPVAKSTWYRLQERNQTHHEVHRKSKRKHKQNNITK